MRSAHRAALIALAAGALVACVAHPPPKPADAAAPTAARNPAAGSIHLHASWPSDAPGAADAAMLEVFLVGERTADAQAAPVVLARATFAATRRASLDVDLGYDDARLDAGAHYVLRATLRDARGRLAAATPTAIVVAPGDTRRIDVVLARTDVR